VLFERAFANQLLEVLVYRLPGNAESVRRHPGDIRRMFFHIGEDVFSYRLTSNPYFGHKNSAASIDNLYLDNCQP
jgi:hypothetical protein